MQNNPDKFFPTRAVLDRYGVSTMSVHRWLKDSRVGFPQPFYIGRRRFWRLADLEAWERSRARSSTITTREKEVAADAR